MSDTGLSDFLDSPWCNSGRNCMTCREDGEIHDNIMRTWPDFFCPLGIPANPDTLPLDKIAERYAAWRVKHGGKFPMPKPCQENKSKRQPCKFGTVGDTLAFRNMPCKGRVVTCAREGGVGISYESLCNKCVFREDKKPDEMQGGNVTTRF